MRRTRIAPGFLLALLLLAFIGCKKDEVTPGFDMIYQQEFSIPPGIGPFVTHHFYLKNLFTRYDALLAQAGKTDADIVGILPVQAAIEGVFGDANFNIVEDASLRIYEESDPNGYIEVAYRFPTPLDPSNKLDLIPSLADAKRIMSTDRFSIDLALRLRNTTTDDTPVRLSLQFKAGY
ncbi:MAG: hypothetical protein H6574_17685 [Lewinellaceae bacterium]|nr:hypothetical protein [Saprospiraceae bacterium]MCB9332902.1 hypothetical protein [Lewinellaceae bacterium]